MDGQEIGRVLQVFDQAELVGDGLLDLLRRSVRIAFGKAQRGQTLQFGLRGGAFAAGFLGIFVGQIIEAEADTIEQTHGFGDGVRGLPEQARGFAWGADMAFGVFLQKPAGIVQGDVFAHTGQDVLQGTADRIMVENVAKGEKRDRGGFGECVQMKQAAFVGRAVTEAGSEIDMVVKPFPEAGENPAGAVKRARIRTDGKQRAVAMAQQILQGQMTFSLRRPAVADGQQP